MAPLPSDLRRDLERAVVRARETAEQGAANAMAVLGVAATEAPAGLSADQRAERVALRAQARALGREVASLGLDELREEIAYGAWHRMLFARFLAENGLLVHPGTGAPVSMVDVEELAQAEGESDPWNLAARYAADMLPGIFGTTDPTTKVTLAPDDRLRLEAILTELPAELFRADDALGWVYQFWQSKRKKEVNAKGDKIGGADLAPVTQLFTEHYMVRFLLENSLGAWWAGRHPDSPLLRDWEYLRYRDDGTPAAGTFDGWPARAAEITVMDPCCGSGHFLVAAADMLRAMRMEEEGLSAAQAAEAVVRDNLYGLELDPRCTQIAAFALVFDAWKAIGRAVTLPIPNIACSGIAIKGQRDDWHRLAKGDTNLIDALDRLYDLFVDAPELGSLIDPRAAAQEGTVWAVDPDRLIDTLERALARETSNDPAAAVFGGAAAGTAKAARLLAGRYWLVATNPPFLGDGAQTAAMRAFLSRSPQIEGGELAYSMMTRAFGAMRRSGDLAMVLPQAWSSQPTSRALRQRVLSTSSIRSWARLGPRAFESITGEVVNVVLMIAEYGAVPTKHQLAWFDVSPATSAQAKAQGLRADAATLVAQQDLTADPEMRIVMLDAGMGSLANHASAYQGIKSGDDARFRRSVWEVAGNGNGRWARMQSTTDVARAVGGLTALVDWANSGRHLARLQGVAAWGRRGIAVTLMGTVRASLYFGDRFDSNIAALVPSDPALVPAIWSFVQSGRYAEVLRAIESGIKVNSATAAKVPFDLEHWTKVAAEQYPNGLPEPHSDDPTQWLFKGKPVGSEAPLQVAVARLLGYRWPDQEPDELDDLADADGIVCLPSVAGDAPAAERLERLLARAYGAAWTPGLAAKLLADAGSPDRNLADWLRDDVFAQHAKLFHNRPFIWHVWDGRKDGFSALLHYHRLDRATLGKLTFTQLGDWIERQKAAQSAAEPGADARLAAALDLQHKLELILAGEPPYDIYVRWKTLAEQPLGWEPDLDDGVRLNIRPFVEAGVLRSKFTINWNKDRGRDPDGSERHNDRHHTIAEKRAARAGARR